MSDKTRRILAIILALAMVGSLAAGVIMSTIAGASGGTADTTSAEVTDDLPEGWDDPRVAEDAIGLARRDADEAATIGDVDAPLVLIEYADYRCPFCGVFNRETMPKLVDEYVESGKIRIEWRDLPLFGEESMAGALAARAAGEQGRFWEFHNAVYADAPERGHLKITDAKVTAWAKEAKVPDLEQFEKDRKDPRLTQLVEADAREAAEIGATGTPTFVIGHELLVGAQSIEVFRDVLDDQLAAVDSATA